MNKLEEMIESMINEGPIADLVNICINEFNSYDSYSEIKGFLREKLVEYARSKVPEKIEDFSQADSYADIYNGHNECIDMFTSRIDQDLQSITDK